MHGSEIMTIVQIVCIFILGLGEFGRPCKGVSLWRAALFLICAMAAGLNVGTWVLYAAHSTNLCGYGRNNGACALVDELIYVSMALTGLTYSTFFVAATLAPPGIGQWLAPLVSCGLFIMSVTMWGYVVAKDRKDV